MEKREMNFGLQPTPEDKRDYQTEPVFGALPRIEDLPDEYRVETSEPMHQKSSDFCVGFTYSLISGAQEGVKISPEWWFKEGKKSAGNINGWGLDLRTGAKVGLVGGLEQSKAPFSLEDKDPTFLRNPANWPPELDAEAAKHRKQAYFKVSGPHDPMDNIRAYMWANKDDERTVAIGLKWGYDMGNSVIRTIKNNGFGHAVAVVGWKHIDGEPFLIIQNSYGKNVGDNGLFYLHRRVVNHWVDRYGAYTFADMPEGTTKEEIQYQSMWYNANIFQKFILILKSFFGYASFN